MTDFDPSNATIDEVHAHLDEHPEDLDAILAAEVARGDEARVTLVSALESQSAAAPETQAVEGEGEAPVKPEDENISPPGEYPSEGIFGYVSEEAEPK